MSDIYNINFGLQTKRMLAPAKRLPKHLAWLRSLVAPLQTLRDAFFVVDAPEIRERARYNSQKIVFEGLLRKTFAEEGIYITNEKTLFEEVYFHNSNEGYSGIFFPALADITPDPVYLYNEIEYLPEFDFIVHIPTALLSSYDLAEIEAVVEKYKLLGVNYTIQTY